MTSSCFIAENHPVCECCRH